MLYNFFPRFEFEAGYRKKSLTDVLVLLERGGGGLLRCAVMDIYPAKNGLCPRKNTCSFDWTTWSAPAKKLVWIILKRNGVFCSFCCVLKYKQHCYNFESLFNCTCVFCFGRVITSHLQTFGSTLVVGKALDKVNLVSNWFETLRNLFL